MLLRTLQRMVNNHSTAEDLLQETYLRVTRALSERPIDHLEPFVYQTARNLALDHLRSRRIQARTLQEDVPLDVLQSVGMTRIDPIMYNGQEIIPLQFLKALLPEPSSLAENYSGNQ